jgi:hypothetical protein
MFVLATLAGRRCGPDCNIANNLLQHVPCRKYVHVYKYITLSQKRLEIQALRCNGETSGRCQHEDITVYYSCNWTAMSAARISTTILASMWACTRHSACVASPSNSSQDHRTIASSGRPRLRVPRVVVLAGHLLAWLGSRQSVEPVTGRFVDTTTCLQDKRDEVVLVGVLRRFDRGTQGGSYHGTPCTYHWYTCTCTYAIALYHMVLEYVHVYRDVFNADNAHEFP